MKHCSKQTHPFVSRSRVPPPRTSTFTLFEGLYQTRTAVLLPFQFCCYTCLSVEILVSLGCSNLIVSLGCKAGWDFETRSHAFSWGFTRLILLDPPERDDISLILSCIRASADGILGCEQLLRDQLTLKAANLGALSVRSNSRFFSGAGEALCRFGSRGQAIIRLLGCW